MDCCRGRSYKPRLSIMVSYAYITTRPQNEKSVRHFFIDIVVFIYNVDAITAKRSQGVYWFNEPHSIL